MILLWLTTILPNAKPPPCDLRVPKSCQSPTPVQYCLHFSAFALMSIGAGGIRPCSLAFDADQIDSKDNPKRERLLESFFGWYYASTLMGVLIAFTGIVYIQDHHGWRVGFGIPVVLMLISTLSFIVAYPLYYKMKNDTKVATPTKNLRFLNKACILTKPEDTNKHPWSLCTIEQVGELKALIRVIPLWSSSIMLSVNMNQSAFPVLQAKSMDRHITENFEIPAASSGFFNIVTLMVWVILYDRVIIPLLSKFKGKPVYISVKLRMGAGLVFSILAIVTSGIIEHIRKQKEIEEGFLNDSHAVVKMSAMWLVPQHVVGRLSEALNIIGQMEFYYSEFQISSCYLL
ncbi:NRT1/ PTR family 1.2-like protein [Tanacetum coccineum]